MAQANLQETVNCPWCKASFDIEPASSASCFKCPACSAASSLGSLRNPDHRPEALEIAKWGALAVTADLDRHTGAYAYRDIHNGKEYIGSGTFVQIGNRLLLATVGHTEPKDGTVTLVKKSALLLPEPISCVIRRVVNKNRGIDVGVFELTADAADRAGLEPIGIDRIHDGGTGNPGTKARLIGYPCQFVMTAPPLPNVRRFHALSYGCEPIESARWQAIPDNEKVWFDEQVHIAIEFSDDVISYDNSLPVPEGTPEPFGMSGGGIWQRPTPTEDDAIWNPHDHCLFGIQSAWMRKGSFLRLIQIIHWLKLVADEYPDLCGELESRFPRLRQMR
jgi:hypothetical protein